MGVLTDFATHGAACGKNFRAFSSQDPTEDYGFGSLFASVDCLVMGRKSFEKVLSFDEWGYADKDVAKQAADTSGGC